MKIHKFTVYAYDQEDYGAGEAKSQLQNMKYLVTAVFHEESADVGEWHVDHVLNHYDKYGGQLAFDQFFQKDKS